MADKKEEETAPAKINPLKQLENALAAAKGVKDILKIDLVRNRYIANYEASSGRTDGKEKYERDAFAMIELANKKPELLECDQFSVMAGFIKAAQYALPIGGGKLSMYPRNVKQRDNTYKKMLVVEPDAHGKKELLERMPTIKKIDEGVVVYNDDVFEYNPRKKEVIKHEQKYPLPKASEETVKAAYCTVHFNDNHSEDVVLSLEELKVARSKSKMEGGGELWKTHYAEAAKKSTYNRCYKVNYKEPQTDALFLKYEAKPEDDEPRDIDHTEMPADETFIVAASSVTEPERPVNVTEDGEEITPTEEVKPEEKKRRGAGKQESFI